MALASLSSGTVTLLFTDIEGSTKLLQELGDEGYGRVSGDHRRIVRETFGAREGTEIDTQGDAFFFSFPRARDAVAVGVPDQRFGEAICAVVEAEDGASPELAELAEHVRHSLAAYKAPRRLVVVDTIGRAPNGKVDYKRLKALAAERSGAS